MKFNCPNCNSLQKFGLQKREVEDGIYEEFIKCSKCRWENVTNRGTLSKLHNEKELKKLKARSRNDPNLLRVLGRKIRRLNNE